jgi:uncharacterized protein YaeQ
MALPSTIHHFSVALSDVDRGVYEALSFKLARHPSETAEYLIARVLAYCLEYTPGIAFSAGGVSEPDEPTLAVRDLTGRLEHWIEIGSPDAAKLHKASKSAPRLSVYTHRSAEQFLRPLTGERIHRAADIAAFALPRDLVDGLVDALDRRMSLDVSVTDGHLFVTAGEQSFEGAIERLQLA